MMGLKIIQYFNQLLGISKHLQTVVELNRENLCLSGERIKPPATSDNSLNPEINYTDNFIIRVKFD